MGYPYRRRFDRALDTADPNATNDGTPNMTKSIVTPTIVPRLLDR
ncbi:hypothetical protein ACQP1G_20945 [Nocardia sp. CA-107356]